MRHAPSRRKKQLGPGTKRALAIIVEFANLWDAKSDASALTSVDEVHELLERAAVALGSQLTFKKIGSEDLPAFKNDQAQTREWLRQLARWKRLKARERADVAKEICEWAAKCTVLIRTHVNDRGKVVRDQEVHPNGVQAVIGEVLVRLLDNNEEHASAVGECLICGTFMHMIRSDKLTCSDTCRSIKSPRTLR